jgi:hypothetical protein
MADLGSFDGRPVLAQGIRLAKTNVVLSEASRATPFDVHAGDVVYVLLETQVLGPQFDPIKDTEAWRKIDRLEAAVGTLVDKDAVFDFIREQHERNVRARDEERGQEILALDADPLDVGGEGVEAKLAREHAEGLHKRRRKLCPECQS